jgi:hypothetical protein
VNDDGIVVGRYLDDQGNAHGFKAVREEQHSNCGDWWLRSGAFMLRVAWIVLFVAAVLADSSCGGSSSLKPSVGGGGAPPQHFTFTCRGLSRQPGYELDRDRNQLLLCCWSCS